MSAAPTATRKGPGSAAGDFGGWWRRFRSRYGGEEHYETAREVQRILQRYRELQDIITILGVDELPEADREIVLRARRIQRFLSQPNFVAEQYTGIPGEYVPIHECIEGFKGICEGRHDKVPEQAFLMAGSIDDVLKKASALSAG